MNNDTSSCLYSGNAWFIEDLYEAFLADPDSIDSEWRDYFKTLQQQIPVTGKEIAHSPVQQAFLQSRKQLTASSSAVPGLATTEKTSAEHQKQVSVLQLINAHRFLGHRQADLDPLKQYTRPDVPELDPAHHGLTEADMDKKFNTGSLQYHKAETSLREIINVIKTTYCRTIGAEYMHINETEQKRWIQQRLESCCGLPEFSRDKNCGYWNGLSLPMPWKNTCIPSMSDKNGFHWKVVDH